MGTFSLSLLNSKFCRQLRQNKFERGRMKVNREKKWQFCLFLKSLTHGNLSDCEIMFSMKRWGHQFLWTIKHLIGQDTEEHHSETNAVVGNPESNRKFWKLGIRWPEFLFYLQKMVVLLYIAFLIKFSQTVISILPWQWIIKFIL